MGETLGPDAAHWFSDVQAPVRAAEITFSSSADVVVVGFGGAGAAAALQAIEGGLSVIALDRFESGGATKASGGVIYAGGGTSIQTDAGVEDTARNMAAYLRREVGEVVSDETLVDFCDRSVETIDWMRAHGVDLRPTLYSKKTSYPGPEFFLYHSDNSLLAPWTDDAAPSARGHRGYAPVEQSRKATNLGGALWSPLKNAALERGLELRTHAEVRRLVVDDAGRVVGVGVLEFADPNDLDAYLSARAKGQKAMSLAVPIIPGSKLILRRGLKLLAKAAALETRREERFIEAKQGVVLAAGGFVFNRKMVDHYAPKYSDAYPLGTSGDDGSGIRLGQSVGGRADNMHRLTAWRFINPPLSFARGMIVNAVGQRFINEMVYGATMGVEIAENQGGRAWLVLDKALLKQALHEVSGKKALGFQKALAQLNGRFGAKSGKTVAALAAKIGVPADALGTSITDYNEVAAGTRDCPFRKAAGDCAALDGPYVAIDIGLSAKLFPCPTLTLGGLVVDEKTGAVDGVAGLYAAGRNAIGVASWNYVSGLSIADGVYSGRRAARALVAEAD